MADEDATSRAGHGQGRAPLDARAIAIVLAGLLCFLGGALAVYSLAVESRRLGTVFVAVVGWTLGVGSVALYRRARRTTTPRD